MAKIQTSKNCRIKTWRWNFYLKYLSAKSLVAKILKKKHTAKSKRAEKKSHKKILTWNSNGWKNDKKSEVESLSLKIMTDQNFLKLWREKNPLARSCSEAIWFQKVQRQKASQWNKRRKQFHQHNKRRLLVLQQKSDKEKCVYKNI